MKRYQILIIEDSKVFNNALAKSLQKRGHQISQAFTLKDAMKALEEQNFDLILLDLILPDGEGDEIIDALPKKMRERIIVLSGDKDIQRRDYIFESGVLDYFSKAIPPQLLLKDINSLIEDLENNSKINVLTVDDSQFMRRMIKKVLSPKRYNVLEAQDVDEGLEMLAKNSITLLLLDYEMPNVNGAVMLEKIKAKEEFSSLPVIVISSRNEKELIARVLKHGASDFIHKPFSTEELILKCDLQIKKHLYFQTLQKKELELQEAVAKLSYEQKAKSDFLANMSHEIRTPLNAIVGFVELLKEHASDEKSIKYLDVIESSSEHLLGVIDDILDLSKIENSKIELESESFDTKKTFYDLYALFDAVAKNSEVSLSLELDSSLPPALIGDSLRIKQVVSNLLSNAIKFTPKNKSVTLRVSFVDEKLLIEVIDEGIGIADDKREKIFEAFSQADASTTRKYGGTGLGLSISSKLVELMGAKLEARSELGKGSAFSLALALPKGELALKKVKETRQHNFLNAKVLLVEDNKANQMFMQIVLKKLDIAFDIANDGLEAVEMFGKSDYDLILMDENMPNMNGMEATKEILAIEEERAQKHTPIIALTANAIKGDREKFLEAGMDEYLTKPVDRQKLQDAMRQFLYKKSKEE